MKKETPRVVLKLNGKNTVTGKRMTKKIAIITEKDGKLQSKI